MLDSYKSLIHDIGKAGAASLFPNDFEYYMLALELADSQGNTIDYFIFPVMPKSIRQSEQKIVNIKKTAGGITTLKTPGFVPKDISISGNFGRKIRVIMNTKESRIFSAINFSLKNGVTKSYQTLKGDTLVRKIQDFQIGYKTGFGAFKMLKAIYEKAPGIDKNGTFQLFFYNLANNENYIVEAISFEENQDESTNNMIWGYTLNLKAVAPYEETLTKETRTSNLKSDLLQKGFNILGQQVLDLVKSSDAFKAGIMNIDVSKSIITKI